MSVVVVGKPGAATREYCYPEATTTTFFWSGSENHTAPRIDYWRCRPCGHTRIQMHDVVDAESFARNVVVNKLRATGSVDHGDERSVDFDDLVSEGSELLWALYVKWSPTLNPSFLSYASFYLPRRIVRWWRRRYGVDGNKPLGSAVSLDAPTDEGEDDGEGFAASTLASGGVRGALGEGLGDLGEGGDSVLRALVLRHHRPALGLEARNGGGAAQGAAGGSRSARG